MSDENRPDKDRDESDGQPEDSYSSGEEFTHEELMRLLGGSVLDEDSVRGGDDPDGDEREGADEAELEELAALDGGEVPDALLSERERQQRRSSAETDWAEEADAVAQALLERVGEGSPEPRLSATRRACELLGDVHRAWPMIHITGTNGKSSTARIAESLLYAHGLRTGLLTSPHLVRLNERIVIDHEPISDERLVLNWRDISPYLDIVDAELAGEGESPLTFFEALTVLAFSCFADAPVDVAVVEVGMGGEWDSTNVADGEVAVFTPIALDHQGRLGSTVEEIARTKAGIIKPSATVVSAAQKPGVADELRRAAELQEAKQFFEPTDFSVVSDQLAVGGRLISVRGIAAEYDALPLPLAGDYQAHNAALAIAAVEAFFGGERALSPDLVAEGLGASSSPGRLELIGTDPTVLVDAAHNPHGAAHLAHAVEETYRFDELVLVVGVLQDKNVEGIVRPLAQIADRIIVTQSDSPRAIPAEDLAEQIIEALGEDVASAKGLEVVERDLDAFDAARREAVERQAAAIRADTPRSVGVLITGSITLVGEAMRIAVEDDWSTGDGDEPLQLGATGEAQ